MRTFRTALTRQVHEAVRIQEWGEDRILNSKAEFNRCTIGRLTLGENNTADEERILRERLEDMKSTENKLIREHEGWERSRIQARRVQELQSTVNLARGLVRSPGRKRMCEAENNPSTTPTTLRKVKRKYPLLEDNWVRITTL